MSIDRGAYRERFPTRYVRPANILAEGRGGVRDGRPGGSPESRRRPGGPPRARRAARPETVALPGQGPGGDLAVHGGGPERVRPVRSQAGTGQERWQTGQD